MSDITGITTPFVVDQRTTGACYLVIPPAPGHPRGDLIEVDADTLMDVSRSIALLATPKIGWLTRWSAAEPRDQVVNRHVDTGPKTLSTGESIPEAEIHEREGRYFTVVDGRQYDVTSTVEPVVAHLRQVSEFDAAPPSFGLPLTPGWHGLGFSSARHDNRELHSINLSEHTLSPEVIERADRTSSVHQQRVDGMPPVVDGEIELTLQRCALSDPEVRQLVDVPSTPEGNELLVDLLAEQGVDHRVIPNPPTRDVADDSETAPLLTVAIFGSSLAEMTSVGRPLKLHPNDPSVLRPGKRITDSSIEEWVTGLGPIAVRHVTPLEWVSITADPTGSTLARVDVERSLVNAPYADGGPQRPDGAGDVKPVLALPLAHMALTTTPADTASRSRDTDEFAVVDPVPADVIADNGFDEGLSREVG
jgi:hypothetical protein